MKYIQVLLAFVAVTSVSARALPADSTLAIREAFPYLEGNQLESREPKKNKAAANGTAAATKATKAGKGAKAAKGTKAAQTASATATGLAARKQDLSDGLKKRAFEMMERTFPTLVDRKKGNGTATANSAAKASKKAAKAAKKGSKTATGASATATAAAVRRDIPAFPELVERKKKNNNGTATNANAASVTGAAKAKSNKKKGSKTKTAAAAVASSTADAAAIKRDLEIMEANRRRSLQSRSIEEERALEDFPEDLDRRFPVPNLGSS